MIALKLILFTLKKKINADFVELPPHLANLSFCNLLCGVIRGALEMVGLNELSFKSVGLFVFF